MFKVINLNVGVDRLDTATINTIEDLLDKDGIYYDNDGSDKLTYNINIGLTGDDIVKEDMYIEKITNLGVYIETERFGF